MADNDAPHDAEKISESVPSGLADPPKRKQSGWKPKWSGNAADQAVLVLKTMEKASSAIHVPGLAGVFFLAGEIVRGIDDVKENKKAFGLLAEEANALAHTLWDECQEIKSNENSASLWKSLEPHVEKFTQVLGKIKETMKKKQENHSMRLWFTSRKDPGFIQELHNELKAAVVQFNVTMQVSSRKSLNRLEESSSAAGHSLSRIEALLEKMQHTGQQLESDANLASSRSNTLDLVDDPSSPEPQVVQPSLGSQVRTSTLESTASDIPAQNTDVVTPTPQVPFMLQTRSSTSSSVQTQDTSGSQDSRGTPSRVPHAPPSLSQEPHSASSGAWRDQALEMEFGRSQARPLRESDRHSVHSPLGFTDSRSESPIPMCRSESAPGSSHSTRINPTNPFSRLILTSEEGRTAQPAPPTGTTHSQNPFASPSPDGQDFLSSIFRSGVKIDGMTVNYGAQNVTTDNSTTHNSNSGNTYNNTTVNSNNRYEGSMDPSFYSYEPTYNFHTTRPPNNYPHYQSQRPPPDHYQAQWSPSPNHHQWPTTTNYYHPPGQPPSDYRGRGRRYY